jgi:sulfite reductase (NADPH) hemoprotein beta-component
VGTALGKYNMHIGSDNEGYRLNKIYRESIDEEQIIKEVDYLFGLYAGERNQGESFGDYVVRTGLVN